MRTFVIGITLGLALSAAVPLSARQFSTARDLRLSFNDDGTVNLTARNVTARDILAEWARQCQCHVVNAERLPGGAIMLPLQFERATQSAVLESLLRQAAGYVLTPKRPGVQSASNYDTIYILATSNPVTGAYVPPPASSLVPTTGGPDDELPPVVPIPMQSGAPSRQAPPQPPASSTFGSRTNSPFVSITPVGGPASTPGTVTPGAAGTPGGIVQGAPPPPGTMPQGAPPAPPGTPPPPGTAVPIVPAPSAPPR